MCSPAAERGGGGATICDTVAAAELNDGRAPVSRCDQCPAIDGKRRGLDIEGTGSTSADSPVGIDTAEEMQHAFVDAQRARHQAIARVHVDQPPPAQWRGGETAFQ